MAEVMLRDLGFAYPGTSELTVRGLDLLVADGSAHALLGASGAGKTTLLNLLSGLIHPTTGDIRFDGRDVSLLGARARSVALVFQFPVLYESMTVQQNLEFPLVNRGWQGGQAALRASMIAEELDLTDELGEKPGALSLYQKQLVAIGKALVRDDVDLVLLDEPLTAVDPGIKWRLRQTLKRLQREHGLTMIYVTHDQTEALTFADEVSVMADGRILQTGSPQEVYESPQTEFVGHFIGSPGMSFVPVSMLDGRLMAGGPGVRSVDVTGGELPKLVGSGQYTLGVRADWVYAVHNSEGEWLVTDVRMLGTMGGEARVLVSLVAGEMLVNADVSGNWRVDDRAEVVFDRLVLFREGVAVGAFG